MLDTHLCVTELKAAGFDEQQAVALVNAIKKTRTEEKTDIVTKADLREFEQRLKTSLAIMLAVTTAVLAVLIAVL